ncbi:MAG: C10 family peptidase [Bacteroidales bacterium]|nr:C10 family peptidase [Bacteroidales bacterium]
MRKITSLLLLLPLFVCCTKSEPIDIQNHDELKAYYTKSFGDQDSFFVSVEDVQRYLHFKELALDDEVIVQDIFPLGMSSKETLCYLIDFDEGWEILSADKRAPVVLGHSDAGHLHPEDFCKLGAGSAIKTWLNCLMRDIQSFRDFHDMSPTEEASREMQNSLAFWDAITSPNKFIKDNQSETKAFGDPGFENGHWELISVSTTSQNVTRRLTTTQWGQDSPFNTYCPPPYYGSSAHSLVGCIAVAGAQQLYYLHGVLGTPATGPTSVSFSGYGPSSYSMSVGNFSPSVWSNMSSDYTSSVGVLLAYVGGMVSMEYGAMVSTASLDSLVTNVFNPNGLQCSLYNSLPANTVYNNLLSGLPIVVGALDPNTVSYINGILVGVGHAFLVDKFKKTDYTTIYTYEWVDDSPIEGVNLPRAMQKQVVVYNTVVNEIGMNWGWPGMYNESWYTLSGNWSVNGNSYDLYRRMIADFAVL